MDSCNRSQPHLKLRSIIIRILNVIVKYPKYHSLLLNEELNDRIIDYIMMIKKDLQIVSLICNYMLILINNNNV